MATQASSIVFATAVATVSTAPTVQSMASSTKGMSMPNNAWLGVLDSSSVEIDRKPTATKRRNHATIGPSSAGPRRSDRSPARYLMSVESVSRLNGLREPIGRERNLYYHFRTYFHY